MNKRHFTVHLFGKNKSERERTKWAKKQTYFDSDVKMKAKVNHQKACEFTHK